MPRRFNLSQKIKLMVAADGHCMQCGVELPYEWHADHVLPYSKGGKTTLSNGQALCPSCNLLKGNKVLPLHSLPLTTWPENRPLRLWQQNALAQFQSSSKSAFLLVATPGAGKTTFALRTAHFLLQSEKIEQIIVVCPTDHLKTQWADAAHDVGIQLDREFKPVHTTVRRDFHGIVTTYQQVASNMGSGESAKTPTTEAFSIICRKRTLLICDEIHHAGDELAWGKGLVAAFGNATYKLALSGTPFRGDNNKIPFITYNSENRCVADYSYTYADSLRDDVCRYINFPKFDGEMTWISGKDGLLKSATFDDDLSEREYSERLNTAISADGEWLAQVLADANQQLTNIRDDGHPQAGGLVISKDQTHAKAVAKILHELTGEEPTLAISEDVDASRKIKQFSKSRKQWIVAVRMVSEGVDIPRLRVAVYATNIATELFFRQAVGRIIRVIQNLEEQTGYFYIPSDPTIKEFAKRIREERDHQIRMEAQEFKEHADEYEIDNEVRPVLSSFEPISSLAEADGAIFNEEDYAAEEVDLAKKIRRAVQNTIPCYCSVAQRA